MRSLRILWVDDQKDVQATLSTLLADVAQEIVHVADASAAIERLSGHDFDLVVLDLKMPPGDWGGLWLLDEIARLRLEVPTLVLSGEGTQTETIKAIRSGAADYVTKDRAAQELLPRVKEVIEKTGPAARLKQLIAVGESPEFECKETLRWNIRTAKTDRTIEHAAAKTLAAFANTKGGTLAIGVTDSGIPVGLAKDKFSDRDAILRHLDNVINTFLGNSAAPLMHARFVEIAEVEVLRIDCTPSESPVYVAGLIAEEVEFYVRRQASSVRLKVDEAVAYIQQRFRQT